MLPAKRLLQQAGHRRDNGSLRFGPVSVLAGGAREQRWPRGGETGRSYGLKSRNAGRRAEIAFPLSV